MTPGSTEAAAAMTAGGTRASAAPGRLALLALGAAAALVAAAPARGAPRRMAATAGTDAAAGPAAAEAAEPARPRVAEVELRLPAGEDLEAAAALVAVEVGEPLSVAGLRRTVQRLFHPDRYRNVSVRTVAVPPPPGKEGEWVRVLVEALPVRRLADVQLRVEGAGLDPAPLRAAARLEPGAVFDEADLEVAEGRVKALLAHRGYREAQVTGSSRGDREVAVELVVAPGEPVRVGAVRLTGEPGAGAASLLAGLGTRPGALLDDDVLAADVKTLRGSLFEAGYRRARVSAPSVQIAGRTAAVELPVSAGPRMTFTFRGNQEIPSAVLSRELGFDEALPVDLPAVGAAADRLAAFYRARGYAAARVEARETQRPGALAVVFHVDEGLRYRIAGVTVEGLSFHDAAWIRERLAALLDEDAPEPATLDADEARGVVLSIPGASAPPAPPPALLPHETLDDAAWDRAAERLVDEWRAAGFLEAVYLGASVGLDAGSRTARTILRFREGPRTFVDAIGFEGNVVVKLPELARESRLTPGAPLEEEKVEATRTSILRIYLARGHLYARVVAREQVDRERHVAVVRFIVDEGPQVRVGRVLVTGNRRTRDHIVRRALTVGEGDVYDPDAVAKSQAALLRLGVFQTVGLRIQDPELPQDTKDLSVELAERPWATLSQGVGFSIANGPRAFLEWGQPNLFGRALEFGARGKVNYPLDQFRPDLKGKTAEERIEGRTDIGLRAPGLPLVRLPATARSDLIGEILHRKAYDLRRATGVLGVDLGVTSRLSFSLQYELEVDKISKSGEAVTQADLERLRYDDTTLHALRPIVTLDYRDNSAHPRRGWFATGAVEWAHSLGGKSERLFFGLLPGSKTHTNMVKLSATTSTYLPVGKTVLALSLRGGRILHLDAESLTVIPRKFFMGGASTMRGYAEEDMVPEDDRATLAEEAKACLGLTTATQCSASGRRIAGGLRPISAGGEVFVLGKAELRLPLRGSLEGALFTDVGNLWSDPKLARLQDLRASVGFGLRFVTPIGPAALDIGFNATPDNRVNEVIVSPHFTIGLF